MKILNNLVNNISKEHVIIAMIMFVFVALSVSINLLFSVVLSILVLIIAILSQKIEYGIYFLIILTPCVYLKVIYGSLDIPLGDLMAILLFFALAVNILSRTKENFTKNLKENSPVFIPFIIFIIACLFSFVNTPDIAVSVKYLFRPLLFLYVMFIMLPSYVISDKKILIRAVHVAFWFGLFISFISFTEYIFHFGGGGMWRRVLPPSFFGLYPLGSNHNLLAEVLVTIIPLSWYISTMQSNAKIKLYCYFCSFFMMIICLLTFSRAGCIVLFLEVIIYAYMTRKNNIAIYYRRLRYFIFAIAIIAPIMYLFSGTNIVKNSNENRLLLTEIAIDAWQVHPFIGNGLNTFITFVSSNTIFLLDFGEPLDSHGVAQKLLVEVGIVGLIGFAFFLASIYYRCFRIYTLPIKTSTKDIFMVLLIASIGITVFELFNNSYFLGKMWLTIGITLATGKIILLEYENKKIKSYEQK